MKSTLLAVVLVVVVAVAVAATVEQQYDPSLYIINTDKRLSIISDSTYTIPYTYPLYLQCDDEWGSHYMGNKTICQVGCLMSSTSMGINGVNIQISDATSTPDTLNTWLKANNGYDNNSLIEGQVPLIDPARIVWPQDAMHTTNDLSYGTVCEYISKGRIVIANVHSGQHFVLLTGYSNVDGDTFTVNDPGFDTYTYSYTKDVVGYRIFDMSRE